MFGGAVALVFGEFSLSRNLAQITCHVLEAIYRFAATFGKQVNYLKLTADRAR